MLDLGTLRLGIKVDGDEAKAQLNDVGNAVTDDEAKTTSLMGAAKKMIKAFAAAYAVKELVKLGKAALDAYADFEQLEGGVQKIFGDDASKMVMENAEKAYKTAGISANKYMEQVTSFSASLNTERLPGLCEAELHDARQPQARIWRNEDRDGATAR